MAWNVLRAAILLGGLAVVAIGWRLIAPISTPPFMGADGKPLPQSIASVERWRINGVEQSVIIRGRDRSNPILVWVHGGPGASETALLRRFDAALEDHFVVVYWDQRFAGQSFDPRASKPTDLTIQQYVDDLGGVVDRLLARFGRNNVLVVGHSWGTVPGILYAEQHPERLFAYVGVGQVVDVPESERRSYDFVLKQAKSRGATEAVRELELMGPPPRRDGSIFTPRDLLQTFGGSFYGDGSYMKLSAQSLGQSEYNWRDLAAFQGAPAYSARLLNTEFANFRIDDRPRTYGVPMFLVSGRSDHQSEASVVREFFERISAPRKAFVWFEKSGHNPAFEEPVAFQEWLVKVVRPLAKSPPESAQRRKSPLALFPVADSGAGRRPKAG